VNATTARLALLVLLATPAVAVRADETALTLADGPELPTVRANCSICHSLDYIQMNAPFLKKAGWEAEVRKMIKVMGAPASDADAAQVIAYLARHYAVD